MPDTVDVRVAGLAIVKIGSGAEGALETLGYSRDGVTVRDKGYFIDVPGDENGGDQGPPVDVQYLGETCIVRIEMTKWAEDIAVKARARLLAGTEGVPGTAGTLMFGGTKSIRLTIHSTTTPLNFPRAFLRGDTEINKGTKFSTLVLEFECHKDGSGNLYNATVE